MRCSDQERRKLLLADDNLKGIDYIEVVTEPPADNQRLLEVHFISSSTPAGQAQLAAMLAAIAASPGKVRIEGGVRIRPIRVTGVVVVGNHLEVRVEQPGDFSTYVLAIDDVPNLDPAFARCPLSFKAGCPSRFDCRPDQPCPPELIAEPLIDYMAKDYASFRRALVDLIPTLVPDWKERNEADLGIALIELLAYVGDHLSYYQDAVANELHLETARQRISVRRHARLIDYRMHDGASARTLVKFWVTAPGLVPLRTQLLSRIDVPLGPQLPPHDPPIDVALAERAVEGATAVFETMQDLRAHNALNEISIYTWGDRECCLPRGATSADLEGDLQAILAPGALLLLEEVLGVETGLAADADPSHRQAVRLTAVEAIEDPLLLDALGNPRKLTRVTWHPDDALTFPLCVGARLTEGLRAGQYEDRISLAGGNLVLADHGRTIAGERHSGPRATSGRRVRAHRIRLRSGPLAFRVPLDDDPPPPPVSALLVTDPGEATAQAGVVLDQVAPNPPAWSPVAHLLDSPPFAREVAVETDNAGRAVLRFGDNEFGLAPPEGGDLLATYRVGVGTAGNVGADSLVHFVRTATAHLGFVQSVRNPLAAWGGIDPESPERVKQLAPAAFHAEPVRAVTEADYARAAERFPEVAKAVATLRWTGSWHTVFVTVDRRGGQAIGPRFESRLRAFMQRSRLAGYDLEIDGPIFVSLEIEIDVCVEPDHFRGHIEAALLAALGSRRLPDGTRGFFHADNFTFGQPVYLSGLYAAVEAVAGVESAEVTVFKRYTRTAGDELAQGLMAMGRLEIARLDNDPNFPENGVLRLTMMGGK